MLAEFDAASIVEDQSELAAIVRVLMRCDAVRDELAVKTENSNAGGLAAFAAENGLTAEAADNAGIAMVDAILKVLQKPM